MKVTVIDESRVLFSGSVPDSIVAVMIGQLRRNKNASLIEEDTIKIVCDYYGLDENKIIGRTRKAEYVKARQIVIYRFIHYFGITTVKAGEIVNRDHATAIWACNCVRRKWLREYQKIFIFTPVEKVVESEEGVLV